MKSVLTAMLLLLLLVVPVKALNCFKIVSVNPTTVNPCEKLELSITLKNIGANTTYYVTTTLTAKPPISVIGSSTEEASNSFGVVQPNDEFTLKYRLYVNASAKPGTYPLFLTVTWTDGIYAKTVHQQNFVVGINVENPPKRADLRVVNVTTEPNPLEPGHRGRVVLVIKNMGYRTAKSVDVYLLAKKPFVTLNSTLNKHIDLIPPGKSVSVDFELGVNENVTQKYYSLPVVLKYRDDFGSYVTNTSVGVSVVGKPDVEIQDIVLEPTTLTPNTQGTLTITVMNAGTAPANDVRIYLYGADDLVAENCKYLGTITPGQTQTVVFGLYVPQTMETGSYGLTISISYKDAFGRTHVLRELYGIVIYPPIPFIPIQYVFVFGTLAALFVLGYFAVKREIVKRRGMQ